MESIKIVGITINNAMSVDEYLAEYEQIETDQFRARIIDVLLSISVTMKSARGLMEEFFNTDASMKVIQVHNYLGNMERTVKNITSSVILNELKIEELEKVLEIARMIDASMTNAVNSVRHA